MSEVILRSNAWKLIDSGEPFDLGFVTADRRRGTGGEYKEVKGYRKVQKQANTTTLPGTASKQIRTAEKLKSDPNHGLHKTINIFDPRNPKNHIVKVHYRLFDRFNGKTVLQ